MRCQIPQQQGERCSVRRVSFETHHRPALPLRCSRLLPRAFLSPSLPRHGAEGQPEGLRLRRAPRGRRASSKGRAWVMPSRDAPLYRSWCVFVTQTLTSLSIMTARTPKRLMWRGPFLLL